ncbi:MAG: hypothetical protein L3J01_04275, partial [Thiomicrorhabdus sp.]|nr:hypothetical protein [Thiomicrorhabdus sp.]
KGVKYAYIEDTKPFLKVIPRLATYYRWIGKIKNKYSVIYIHESGVLGLFLAKKIKKMKSESKVIFDYHDFVQWEVFFQIGKVIRVPVLRRVLWKIILVLLKLNFINRVLFDGLVGISESQKDNLLMVLQPKLLPNTLVIPNTRAKNDLSGDLICNGKNEITYLWVGNIVNGRDLEFILFLLDNLKKENEFEFSFKIIGNVISSELFNKLKTRAYFEYLGGFESDQDILGKLGKGLNVGIFMGWMDDFDVGINEIASPNKLYSYLNIGIPIICHSRLEDFSKILGKESGFFVDDYRGFLKASLELRKDYAFFKKSVLLNRNNIDWDNDVNKKLEDFLIKNFMD